MNWRWPLAPGTNRIRAGSVSNTFGMVRRYADGRLKAHQGWDFRAKIGTPCFAVDSGVVESVQARGDFGLVVLLRCDHLHPQTGGRMYVLYAHLQSAAVQAGDRVEAGAPIGLTGNSGNAAGLDDSEDHLHFEVRTPDPWPGLGLDGRTSPLALYGRCPLTEAA